MSEAVAEGTAARPRRRLRIPPVVTMILALIAIWYVAAVPMNIKEVLTQAERDGAVVSPDSAVERRDMSNWALVLRNPKHIGASWATARPRLPAPATSLHARTLAQSISDSVSHHIHHLKALLRKSPVAQQGHSKISGTYHDHRLQLLPPQHVTDGVP